MGLFECAGYQDIENVTMIDGLGQLASYNDKEMWFHRLSNSRHVTYTSKIPYWGRIFVSANFSGNAAQQIIQKKNFGGFYFSGYVVAKRTPHLLTGSGWLVTGAHVCYSNYHDKLEITIKRLEGSDLEMDNL